MKKIAVELQALKNKLKSNSGSHHTDVLVWAVLGVIIVGVILALLRTQLTTLVTNIITNISDMFT